MKDKIKPCPFADTRPEELKKISWYELIVEQESDEWHSEYYYTRLKQSREEIKRRGEYLEDGTWETLIFFNDVPAGTRGEFVKTWVEPKAPQNRWIKLHLGENQSGQKLRCSFPKSALKRVY